MQTDVIIAGFGGQGVLFAGQVLAHAALDAGLHTTWFPSYGPEMRGGTAHCTVVVADAPIGSPVVRNPQAAVAMNLPSMERYRERVRTGGVLVVNRSLVERRPLRDDLTTLWVPSDTIAEELGDKRLSNMVLLGALLVHLPLLTPEAVEATLEHALPERKRALLDANRRALRRGAELARAGGEAAGKGALATA
jgi:2-oxoglutarate ferredoxin oxidoreductase subunit gamma